MGSIPVAGAIFLSLLMLNLSYKQTIFTMYNKKQAEFLDYKRYSTCFSLYIFNEDDYDQQENEHPQNKIPHHKTPQLIQIQ